ncbi:Fpg/Nei family DNA glycosylase [Patescibacteria group bacterium]
MPELPEVQTIVNDLNEKVKGEKIVDFWSDWKKNVRPGFSEFKKGVVGVKIVGARRIGKQIVIDLDNGNSVLIHLKMSGHLLYKKFTDDNLQKNDAGLPRKFLPEVALNYFVGCRTHHSASLRGENDTPLNNLERPPSEIFSQRRTLVRALRNDQRRNYFNEKVNQYIHHIFYFESGATLEFSDMRKFAWLGVVKTDEVESQKEISQLGIDALSPGFTLKKFKEILEKKKKGVIGTVLLDQGLIAGIGNIYRSEILFLAGVNPKRKVSSLNEKEIEKIFKSIKDVLKKAIKMRGTSDSDYRDIEGKPGKFHEVLNVYRREGEKCKKCKNKITREKLGQRSIFYCPKCQK